MRSLAVAASFASSVEVIQQKRLIFRVSNLINDDRSFFFRSQATEVSNAAFGNDNVNVEGCMVDMAAERNNGADFAAFCQGVGEEYGEVTVTGKVAGAANAVHQFGAADMSGVYVAVNINFDSGVQRQCVVQLQGCWGFPADGESGKVCNGQGFHRIFSGIPETESELYRKQRGVCRHR